MRGAWIEIEPYLYGLSMKLSRSPCGERGLKFSLHSFSSFVMVSLPMRGAWIEISNCFIAAHQEVVAPHAGSVD